MGTVITNLKARFGVDSSDFKKGLKDGEKAVDDFKDSAGGALDKFASMFGINMSAVNDAMGTATKSLNFLGQSITALGTGANKAAVAFKLMKTVLISTGIGALVVALGSLVAYFQKSGEGADKFAKILAQVKSVVNNVIDRLAIFGKGVFEIATGKFKQGWETMRGAFKGIGDEIKEDWKASGQLADEWDALEDREIALINSLAERKAKAAELRLLAKEETEDQKKRLGFIQQAEAVYRTVYDDEIRLARDRFELTKRQIALQASDPIDDQRRELRNLEAAVNEKIEERDALLKGLVRERSSSLAIVKEEAALEKAKVKELESLKTKITGIKIPELAIPIQKTLGPLEQLRVNLTRVVIDMKTEVNSAFAGMSVAPGFLSSAFIPFKDLSDNVKSVMIDMTSQVTAAFAAISRVPGLTGMPFTPFDALEKNAFDVVSKLPGLLANGLAPFTKFKEDVKSVMVDVTSEVNSAFEGLAVGIGEFFGALASGNADAADFGKMIIGTFADLAVQIGKIVIGAALAVAGIDKALKIPGAWPVALAAGVALVAIGSAVKGALSSAASGGGSSGSAGSMSAASYTYNTNAANTAPVTIRLEGEFVQRGSDLVAVVNTENQRKYKNT